MATETITVLKVGTDEAVRNIKDLKDNISALKKELDRADATFEENAAVTEELRKNQAALRDAMYGTATATEDLIKQSEALYDENGKVDASYNALVKTMAQLKSAWRATSDQAERAALGKQIDRINTSLKQMDASVGNFGRNVGNYLNSFRDALSSLPGPLGKVGNSLGAVNTTMGVMSKQPLLFLLSGIVIVIEKITKALKDNETAQQDVAKIMKALEPVFNFFENILETIAGWISEATDKILEWAGASNGSFKKIIAGATGVGNAILQFVLAPIRTTIAAAKGLGEVMKNVFHGQFKEAAEAAKTALGSINDAWKTAFSFKSNYEAGQEVGEQFASGIKSPKSKKAAKSAGKETADAFKDGFLEELDRIMTEIDADLERQFADIQAADDAARDLARKKAEQHLAEIEKNARTQMEWNDILTRDANDKAEYRYQTEELMNQKKLEAMETFKAAALKAGDLEAVLDYEQRIADLRVEIAQNAAKEQIRQEELVRKKAEETAAARLSTFQAYAGAISSLFGNLADIYEQDSEANEKAAKQAKALRIASATIDTISGAIGAYMQAVASIPPPAGIIVGAIQAAAVTAAGIAQIAKIRNTQVSRTSSGSAALSATAETAAAVNPVNVGTAVQQTSIVRGASEEQALNTMAKGQKVVIVQSDIEASLMQARRVAVESSF